MKEIKEKIKLKFNNHQLTMCSDIKTKMVWVIANNEEPLLNFSTVK